MKIPFQNFWLYGVVFSTFGASIIRGQGTVTFDGHNNWVGTNYSELGMQFRVFIPQGSSYDYMGITVGADNTPRDGTPFMNWFRQYNPYDYVILSLTNGSTFGLTSVWLADPTAPSPSSVVISFVGLLSNGLNVTNTFVTPGNGATTFQTYTFTTAFAAGLTSVELLAPRLAMDNLVFTVPEPGAMSLLVIGLFLFAARKIR